MALIDILKSIGTVAAGGGQALGNALEAQGNPLAYQQQQETQRQHEQLLQQLQMRNTLSAGESAQLQMTQQAQQEQSGRDVWNAIAGGATLAPEGTEPDFSIGGRGFLAPHPDSGYAIPADSDLGKYLGLQKDVGGLTPIQYLKVFGDFSATQQAQKNDVASKALLDTQKQNARLWLTHRFSPQFSQTLYGAADPTAALESQNLANELEAVTDQKGMSTWQDKSRGYQTEWEKLQQKKLETQQALALKAAETPKTDPHLSSTLSTQSRQLADLRKPIETEWNEGNNILAFANQRTPQADSLLVTAMLPYTTGVKRFNQAEIANAKGGATAWTQLQGMLNKFAADPGHAQIPEVQRQQIISLIQQKQANLKSNLDKINDAEDEMSDLDTSAAVYKRASKLHRDLDTYQQTLGGGTLLGGITLDQINAEIARRKAARGQ